jgi:WD40 repeat protein
MTDQGNEHTRSGNGSKADATGEFFSLGQPLHALRAGYVKRRADDVLYDTIAAGRYAHVIAPDRSGKTSLMAATAARLEANGFKVAILDLTQIGERDGGSDAGRFYYSVAYRLLRQLRIRTDLQSWWQDKSILSNRQRLVEFYSEVILGNLSDHVVVFVDGLQCIGELPFADQLLASIRAAHNSRTTDPDFARLTFALLGECDPNALVEYPETSPFHVTQPVALQDFSREETELFGTELGISPADASTALDRIHFWTGGQPYLTQRLARAVAREGAADDVNEQIDRLVVQQFVGRNVMLNERHLAHIHRRVVNHPVHATALLNLYGRIRKGIEVQADLGSPLHRFLIAIGLVVIDDERCLAVRNRLYAAVFTARWANENLPVQWRGLVVAAGVIFVMLAVPFWYTQLLPRGYVDTLTSLDAELQQAADAYVNFNSFPGHGGVAENLYRKFLQTRAARAEDEQEIARVSQLASEIPDAGRFPQFLEATYWDRVCRDAMREERRDDALIAALESLVLATPQRRQRAAALIADDYPLLQATLLLDERSMPVFDDASMILTQGDGAQVSQWSYDLQGISRREDWSVTALEVTPLLRRVLVDRQGTLSRVGLTLNISHARLEDLRVKLIAPSGRTVEIDIGVERSASSDDIRVDTRQLRDLIGESVNGTWSVSIRDEALGVAGHLVGWNLQLNSQGVVEGFERGLNIPDPVERETDNTWFSDDGRYVIARAMQSDSARIWDLALAKPIRAIAVGEDETVIGLDAGARRLVTAAQDRASLWDVVTGNRVASLDIGAASADATLTGDGKHLFVRRSSDSDTVMELWSLDTAERIASLTVAGTPALITVSESGERIAIADYDRAVRLWDTASGELLAQIDLVAQPSAIALAAGGARLGVVYGEGGVSLWNVESPGAPLLEIRDEGRWELVFSPSGTRVLAGNATRGYRVYGTSDGGMLGPALGPSNRNDATVVAFSADEQTVITSNGGTLRFWRMPVAPIPSDLERTDASYSIWSPSGDSVMAVTPDARHIAIGDRDGGVHVLPTTSGRDALREAADQVTFLGHNDELRLLRMNRDGSLVASAAADNTIRVWNVPAGDPLPFSTDIPGAEITRLDFSADSSLLAVLNGNAAQIVDAASGEIVAAFELGENHAAIAFAGDESVYVGGDSGALRVMQRDGSGGWSLQTVWQGDAPLRWLEASSGGDYLVVVDADHRASQFHLAEGRPGEQVIVLPGPVSEVRFSPAGSRVMFRTSRWVHRARSSPAGLLWLDSAYGPAALAGSRIAHGEAPDALGDTVFVPVADAGFVRMAELAFGASDAAGLFGRREDLLEEWQTRLGIAAGD